MRKHHHYAKTVDYPGELSNGFQVMLDSGEVVIVRWDQVAGTRLGNLSDDTKQNSDGRDHH